MTKKKKPTTTTTKAADGPDRQKLEALAESGGTDEGGAGQAPGAAPEQSAGSPRARAAKITLSCAICGTAFKTQAGLDSHVKRYHPDAPPPPPEIAIPHTLARAIIAAPYQFAAARWGAHLALTDDELDAMVEPHIALAQRYLPETVRAHAELYTVLLLHSLAIVSRMEMHARLLAKERANKADQGAPAREPDQDRPGETRFGQIRPAP